MLQKVDGEMRGTDVCVFLLVVVVLDMVNE